MRSLFNFKLLFETVENEWKWTNFSFEAVFSSSVLLVSCEIGRMELMTMGEQMGRKKGTIHPVRPLSHRWRQNFAHITVLLEALAMLVPKSHFVVILLLILTDLLAWLNSSVAPCVCTRSESFGSKQKSGIQAFTRCIHCPPVFRKRAVMCDWHEEVRDSCFKRCCHPERLRMNFNPLYL